MTSIKPYTDPNFVDAFIHAPWEATKRRRIGFLIFTAVDVVDLCGPMDVFLYADRWVQISGRTNEPGYELLIIADTPGPTKTSGGPQIVATHGFNDVVGDFDTLVVPGGPNNTPISITDVAGINDTQSQTKVSGFCGTCQNNPNIGNHTVAAPLNIGIASAGKDSVPGLSKLDISGLPVFTLECASGPMKGQSFVATDPGRTLISGKCADIGRAAAERKSPRQIQSANFTGVDSPHAIFPQRLGGYADGCRPILQRSLQHRSYGAADAGFGGVLAKLEGGLAFSPAPTGPETGGKNESMRPFASIVIALAILNLTAAAAIGRAYVGQVGRIAEPSYEGRSIDRDGCAEFHRTCPPGVELNDKNREYCQAFGELCQ